MFKLRKHTIMGETAVEPKGFSSPAASDRHIERHLSEVEKARQDLLKACQEMMESQQEELATSPLIPAEPTSPPAAMATSRQIEPDLSREEQDALLEGPLSRGNDESVIFDAHEAHEDLDIEAEKPVFSSKSTLPVDHSVPEDWPKLTKIAVPSLSLAEQILAATQAEASQRQATSHKKPVEMTVTPVNSLENQPLRNARTESGRAVLAQNSPILSCETALDDIMQAIVMDDIASHRHLWR